MKPKGAMGLPVLRRCCVYIPLEIGGYLLCFLSIMLCIATITAGSWNLPRHKDQEPEDNLISMSTVMFSTLSIISHFVTLAGLRLKRPGYLQLSLLCTSVFTLCLFLVAVVTCLFSPNYKPYLEYSGNIALVVVAMVLGAAYALYYLTIVNSLYNKMKMAYGDSAIPI